MTSEPSFKFQDKKSIAEHILTEGKILFFVDMTWYCMYHYHIVSSLSCRVSGIASCGA